MQMKDLLNYMFPDFYITQLSERLGEELWPPQVEAIQKGLFQEDKGNFFVAIPAGSGKTLIAELSIVWEFLRDPRAKICYLVPFKALAEEKFQDFNFLEGVDFELSLSLSTGDTGIDEGSVFDVNLAVMTYEMFEFFCKNHPDWVQSLKLVIIDEAHLISSETRGIRLEISIARLLANLRQVRLLLLATHIANPEVIAGWLECGENFVVMDWRKNKLNESVFDLNTGTIKSYENGRHVKTRSIELPSYLASDDEKLLFECISYLKENESKESPNQILVFCPTREKTRRMAQALAKNLEREIARGELTIEKDKLKEGIARLEQSSSSSSTIERFKDLLRRGVAYHHAGLSRSLRNLIESLYRKRHILALTSTTTLGAGVNLPASRVYFYEPTKARQPLSLLEYKNMAGRAGRPQFTEVGESILKATSSLQVHSYRNTYLTPDSPTLDSSLTSDSADRLGVVLRLISDGNETLEGLMEIFKASLALYGKDASAIADMEKRVDADSKVLQTYNFIEAETIQGGKRYHCTHVGHAVADALLDPDDAALLINNLRQETIFDGDTFKEELVLFTICLTGRLDHAYIPGATLTLNRIKLCQELLRRMDIPGRKKGAWSSRRIDQAFILTDPLSDWMNGVELKQIEETYSKFPRFSIDELVERWVPDAVYMLKTYKTIAADVSLEEIGATEESINAIAHLTNRLELGAPMDLVDLGKLLGRKYGTREILSRLQQAGITTPSELLACSVKDYDPVTFQMNRHVFFVIKCKALVQIDDKDERKNAFVRLFGWFCDAHPDIIEGLIEGGRKFEWAVREALTDLASTDGDIWVAQALDKGVGSQLPLPEVHLYLRKPQRTYKVCVEAKANQSNEPITNFKEALSPLVKCAPDSDYLVTVGHPNFDKSIDREVKERKVSLFSSRVFALVYSAFVGDYLTIQDLLNGFHYKGIVHERRFKVYQGKLADIDSF